MSPDDERRMTEGADAPTTAREQSHPSGFAYGGAMPGFNPGATPAGGAATDWTAGAGGAAPLTPEMFRAAVERQNAALMAMGPQMMAQYAAYLAYAQSQMGFGAPAAPWGPGPAFGAGPGHGFPPGTHPANVGGGEIAEHAHAGDKRKTQHGGKSSRVKVGTTTGTSTKKKNATSKAHKTKERRVCVNCKSTETPFWRKGKDGVGSLCNACGLYLAKNDAHRPPLLWKRSSSASEINGSDKTAETTQRIMDEGRDVNDAQPSADDVQTESAPVTTTATVVVNEALNQDISQDERKMMISAVESVKKDAQGGAEK
jgi:hypothetical protein